MVVRIFGFLEPKELGVLASVSQSWKSISEDDEIWSTLYQVGAAILCDPLLMVALASEGKAHIGSAEDQGKAILSWCEMEKSLQRFVPHTQG